jgi:hypothetical protein
VALVAIYTATKVLPNAELFVHYGDQKKRSYEVGDPAPLLPKRDILESELPRCWIDDAEQMTDAFRSS